MTARAHAAAVKALLSADTALTVYDGEVPNPPARKYAVLYVSTPIDRTPRLSADMGQRLFTVAILNFGQSPNECRWVVEHTQACLRRIRPIVADHDCTPLRLVTGGQVNPDDSITPPGWAATDVWQFSSTG